MPDIIRWVTGTVGLSLGGAVELAVLITLFRVWPAPLQPMKWGTAFFACHLAAATFGTLLTYTIGWVLDVGPWVSGAALVWVVAMCLWHALQGTTLVREGTAIGSVWLLALACSSDAVGIGAASEVAIGSEVLPLRLVTAIAFSALVGGYVGFAAYVIATTRVGSVPVKFAVPRWIAVRLRHIVAAGAIAFLVRRPLVDLENRR